MHVTNPKALCPSRLDWDRGRSSLAAARAMDLAADLLLSEGKTSQAERLAHLAAEMRGGQ